MLKKQFVMLASLWMLILIPMTQAATSTEFNLVNGLNNAIKKDAKSKTGPSLVMQGYLNALEAMGSASDFADYTAPVIAKDSDILETLLSGVFNKSELNKIKKSGMLKDGTSQREWLKAMVTVSVDVAYRKELISEVDYVMTQLALTQMWGSAEFMKNRLPQMYDFFIEGSLVSSLAPNSSESVINANRDMIKNGFA